MTTPAPRAPLPLGVVVALFAASIALRPQLLAIGPLLPLIRADLELPAGIAGLLTTIPVLCMGIFAPIGPQVAARLGPRTALAGCLALIAGAGLLRALAPSVPLILLATFVIGVAVGVSGAIPAIVVAQRLSHAAVHGTSAYAAGIVAGSTTAAAVAVPLAFGGEWRTSLAIISAAILVPLVAWLVLLRPDPSARALGARAVRLPWRSATGWLLVALFGIQSILYYGIVSWLPNALVERGWSPASTGTLIAIFNGIGLLTTIGVPWAASRLGSRRAQLGAVAAGALTGILGVVLAPDLSFGWIVILGLSLGAVFPLLLTLPVDVSANPGEAGSIAALMLLGGYVLASTGPVVLGVVRDVTGNFSASMWLLVGVALVLLAMTRLLSPSRLRRAVHAPVEVTGAP